MKAHLILTCTCAAALVLPFSSCSSQKSSTAGYDTAEPIANGEIPPWIAESSDPSYESGHYSPVASNSDYSYNPPAKPSVNKKSTTRKSAAKSTSSSHAVAKKLRGSPLPRPGPIP